VATATEAEVASMDGAAAAVNRRVRSPGAMTADRCRGPRVGLHGKDGSERAHGISKRRIASYSLETMPTPTSQYTRRVRLLTKRRSFGFFSTTILETRQESDLRDGVYMP
jgi:hypothetical protein